MERGGLDGPEEGIKSRIYERAISETDKFSERARKRGAA